MLPENHPDQWLLAYIMSNISERCYYATWMENLEYILWHSVTEGPRRYGHSEISSDDITALKILSERCGEWIFFDEANEETPISLELWQAKYAQHIEYNPRAITD